MGGQYGDPRLVCLSPLYVNVHMQSVGVAVGVLLCFSQPFSCNLSSCVFHQVWSQLCDRPCFCPTLAPQCPPGVPLVPDACRCCPVCARQLGEPCSRRFPCDGQRGLQCDYSASFPGGPGECVGEVRVCVGRADARPAWVQQHVFKDCSAEHDRLPGGDLCLF